MIPENNKDWATPALKEALFWRDGMTPEEYDEERTYLGRNYDLFLNGSYRPLWAQREGKEVWIKSKVKTFG